MALPAWILPWMPWATLLPLDACSHPVPPSVWGAAGALHGDISMYRPLLPGLSHGGCLLSLAGTLLWVAVCDHLLSPHRSLATWGSSTVKWSLWMALCTVTHTQAMCWWRSAQPPARLTLSSWITGSTRYVSMRGFQGLEGLPLGIRLQLCPSKHIWMHFSYYFHNPPMIFFDSEMEDRTQARGARLSPLFPVLRGLLGTMSPFPGAERVIPHGLLPPVAGPHQGWYEESAEVQPAAWGWGFVSSLCLHADCQILGICQQGHWPVTSLCQRGRSCVSFPNVCPSFSSVPFFIEIICTTDSTAVLGNPWQLCGNFCIDSWDRKNQDSFCSVFYSSWI